MGQSQNNLFSIADRDLDEIVRRAHADLAALRGARLFVTGGTGFFGKWLLAALLHANAAMDLGVGITVLSRRPEIFARQYPDIRCDALRLVLGHVAAFRESCGPFDYVVHAAADTTSFTTEADERERSHAIVAGTRHLLDFTRKSGVRRLLNISSGAIYGLAASRPGGAREEEADEAQAATPYGQAKREAEIACSSSGLDTVTARAFAFLGPHLPLDAHFAAGNFLRDARRGGPVRVRGDGTALRSYLYPSDLIVWLLRILVRGQRGRAYNVGSNEIVSTAQLARLIAETTGRESEVIVEASQPAGPQNIYLPDITRARRELALEVEVPLREAIARTLEFIARAGRD